MTERFRAGTYGPQWLAFVLLFLVLGVLAVVAPFVGDGSKGLIALGAFMLLFAVAFGGDAVTAVRSVVVRPGPGGTVAVPVFSWRSGFGRMVWPLAELESARMAAVYSGRDAHVRAVLTGPGHAEIRCDGLTCSFWRRRHPERSKAGRCVARLSDLADQARTAG